ncbi:probable amidase At4g34880 [Camellia sinensis]|uniref:probable amidase At4g34880 n=1 Tax=Camellia sinensis TaxID=4442 RepID=UPI001036F192|nr:probable amidase At4g34880 [Camellia sinensis]
MAIYNTFLIFLGMSFFGFIASNTDFPIKETSAHEIQIAFKQNKLTSRQLVEFYLTQIESLNPLLRSVIEVNPEALFLADKADRERNAKSLVSQSSLLHGIPILLKDNIATKDKLNTTAGSYALLGSVVARDAGVVAKLRKAGAIVLGKASTTEWAAFRSSEVPSGWCARAGQAVNPYVKSADPGGSSTGSSVSVAANMVTLSLGTETAGSILCPSSYNSAVGIKPTVGLTSRGGVVPISPRQDTVGPICRTVSDAVYVLDAIVGFDPYDAVATRKASKYIPHGGYVQFLKVDGLRGKRLGITSYPFFGFTNNSDISQAFKLHFNTLRQRGAILVDILDIPNFVPIMNSVFNDQGIALLAEFKLSLNAYLKDLLTSPVRSLADAIAFNKKFSDLEKIGEYGQDLFLKAEKTNGMGELEKKALRNLTEASKYGLQKLMKANMLDALVTPMSYDFLHVSGVLAIGGFPGISVPAGYDHHGRPFGICFGGLKGFEPKLIEIAYSFEQATKIRKQPLFRP